MAGDEQVRSLFEATRSALDAKSAMDAAVRQGQTAAYHRILRDTPHVRYTKDLVRARKHVSDYADEIRAAEAGTLEPDHKEMYVTQLRRDMGNIAAGTMAWLNDQLNPQPDEPEPAPEAAEPPSDEVPQ